MKINKKFSLLFVLFIEGEKKSRKNPKVSSVERHSLASIESEINAISLKGEQRGKKNQKLQPTARFVGSQFAIFFLESARRAKTINRATRQELSTKRRSGKWERHDRCNKAYRYAPAAYDRVRASATFGQLVN
jgi:DNA/RNA endonuclease G (NUC1)